MKKSIILSLLLVVISIMALHAEGSIDTVWHKPLDFGGWDFAGMEISPDGSKVILSLGANFYVYETENGDLIKTIEGEYSPYDFHISDNWKYIVTTGYKRFTVYDYESGEIVDSYDGFTTGCGITPDGSYAVFSTFSIDRRSYLYKYDLNTKMIVDSLEYPYPTTEIEEFQNLYISPDGRYFFYEVCNYDAFEETCYFEFWLGNMLTFTPLKIIKSWSWDKYTGYHHFEVVHYNTKNEFTFNGSSGDTNWVYNYDNFTLDYFFMPENIDASFMKFSRDDVYGIFLNSLGDWKEWRLKIYNFVNEIIILDEPFYTKAIQVTPNNKYIISFTTALGLLKIRAPWETVGVNEEEQITKDNLIYTNGNLSYDYYLEKPTEIEISIHDINGSFIKELINTYQPSGEYSLNENIDLPSGSYFLLIEKDGVVSSKQFFVVN